MKSGSVHIVTVGARTPLGLTAETSAAAVRAGICRFAEHPLMTDTLGNPMCASIDTLIEPGQQCPNRMIDLTTTALEEICRKLLPFKKFIPSLSILLGLPEIRPGWTDECTETVKQGIAGLPLPFQIRDIMLFPKGHAAGLMAIEAAFQKIHSRRAELFVVGGVDSYFHPDTIEWLIDNRQLFGEGIRSGFIPGEGAGFCVLACGAFLQKARLTPLAEIRSAHTAVEPNRIKTDTICLGEGLTQAVRETLKPLALPQEKIEGVICDINGERYRGEEWGFTILRHPHAFVDPTDYELPSSNWGDVGAASGPLFFALAVAAGQRGYAKGKRYMLWASSEGGERSSVIVELNEQMQGIHL